MSVVDSILSGELPGELREALWTLVSCQDVPYLDVPGTDGPGICVGTSLADIRRFIEAEYEARQSSRPKVPANYSISGRRKLPDIRPQYRDAATQTESTLDTSPAVQARPRAVVTETPLTTRRRGTPTGTQIESAPEAGARGRQGRRPLSRVVCSSSSETDWQGHAQSPPRPVRPPNQGLPPPLRPSSLD